MTDRRRPPGPLPANRRKDPMSHCRIPVTCRIARSTPFFTKETVPSALLTHHNTAEGVYGQLCVMAGRVTFFGFADREATEPEVIVEVEAGEFTTTRPQYWHRIEVSDDVQFNINFWTESEEHQGAFFSTRSATERA